MKTHNVRSEHGVTLVGGGEPCAQNVDEALKLAPLLVAADGGANFCADMGHEPAAIIGDFDSLSPAVAAQFSDTELIKVSGRAEQDTTDFQKCISRIEAHFILAVGFTDARLDHTLATFGALAQMEGPPTLLLGSHDVVFAAPRELVLALEPNTRVSLFPMESLRGTSEGLEWPIDGMILSPMGRIGTSNRALGAVHLRFEKAGCLVLTPRETLPVVLASLTG